MMSWNHCGILRIGASITLGTFLLPEAMKQFRKTYPDVRLKAMVANGRSIQEALLDNRLDFAVIEGGGHNERLKAEVLGNDRLVPVLPPDDPRNGGEYSFCELASSALLLRENGSVGRSFLNHLFSLHNLSVDPVMESVSTQAILQAVHAGLGISFLPERLVKAGLQDGFVGTCRLTDETLRRENYLVYHKNKYHAKPAQEMMMLLHRLAADSFLY